MNTRRPRFWGGLFVAVMLTAALMAVFFVGWRVAGLPFVPFDMFDWLTRVLPVIIESMSITEQQYDSLLNPVQAEVSIGLAVVPPGEVTCSRSTTATRGS